MNARSLPPSRAVPRATRGPCPRRARKIHSHVHAPTPTTTIAPVFMPPKKHVYQPTDIVLAKVKGFPAWPALVVPEEIAPANVLEERPGRPTVEELDDEQDPDNFISYSDTLRFRKNFKPHNSYLLKFLCDDSYIWLKPTDFKPLTPEQCDAWLSKSSKKSKKLIPAFELARRGTQGPDGIDVWEFVQYGSSGKPAEEEYVEPAVEHEQEEGQEKEEEEEEEEAEPLGGDADADADADHESALSELPSSGSDSDFEEDTTRRRRPTRGTRQSKRTRGRTSEREPELQGLQDEPDPEPAPKKARSHKKKQPKKEEVEKYKFEDDEDWSIVGLGPQDPPVSKCNSLVNKLSQKKNLEVHNEFKADLRDRLSIVNKMLIGIVFDTERKSAAEDLHVLVDELEQCSALRGTQDELITVFLSDHELVINISALFNLKQDQLREAGLYDKLQQWFSQIYGSQFVADPETWSLDRINDIQSHPQEDAPSAADAALNGTGSTIAPATSSKADM
ncbi:LAQU0S05e01332g1_1 [Lachancea quebecensis]|uniref:LAQU0S05e01332g1_1 n=1 Tax=Lachancea quebecensis TaxID=1654605 RepID=A0A0P1KRF9_9SACH|nr:LAQU0S05e01332g1_1 [Lachancea quebecensis]